MRKGNKATPKEAAQINEMNREFSTIMNTLERVVDSYLSEGREKAKKVVERAKDKIESIKHEETRDKFSKKLVKRFGHLLVQ